MGDPRNLSRHAAEVNVPKGQPTTIAGAYYAGGTARTAMRSKILAAIRAAEGNLALVSRQLGVSSSTLYRWLDTDRFNLFDAVRAEFPSAVRDRGKTP